MQKARFWTEKLGNNPVFFDKMSNSASLKDISLPNTLSVFRHFDMISTVAYTILYYTILYYTATLLTIKTSTSGLIISSSKLPNLLPVFFV